jgi:hypothetical protein
MATRVKVGSNRKETLDQLYNITGNPTFCKVRRPETKRKPWTSFTISQVRLVDPKQKGSSGQALKYHR